MRSISLCVGLCYAKADKTGMPKSANNPDERQRAIEILLLWEGRVSRARLLELFDVHGTVLSRDIAAYREAFPDACSSYSAGRAYEVTSWAKPQLTKGYFAEYEGLVGTRPAEGLRASVELVSTEQHATNIHYRPFSRIHAAIRDCQQVLIQYRSLSNPEAHQRTIRPHAFVQAGPRWHLRAYCERAQEFRDFNLSRISSVGDPSLSSLPGAELDHAWNAMVKLRLVPHPALNALQSKLVRDEYMGGTVAVVFDVRQAVAKYVVRAFHAAIDTDTQLPPAYILAVDKPLNFAADTFFSR